MLCFIVSVKFIMTIIVAEYMQVSSDRCFVGDWAVNQMLSQAFWTQ